MRSATLCAVALLALLSATASAGLAQRGTHAIRGVTHDSASGLPLAGALVQLRGDADMRSTRSDDAGRFRFAGLAAGTYRVVALRIGYGEVTRVVELVDRDAEVGIALLATPQALAATRVRGDISAIYGMVGGLPDLLPLAGAKVQVMGASKTVDVDSSGSFFIPVEKPGTYFVRISKPGFAEQRFPVEVPDGRAVDASRLLDPSARTPNPALEFVFRDADERIRARGYNSALVPGSEIRAGGTTLLEALERSPAFAKRGLRFGSNVCIFVNGRPSALPLQGINVDEVETVEVYGLRGEITVTLANQTPRCPSTNRSTPRRTPVAGSPEIVRTVVIWLKP